MVLAGDLVSAGTRLVTPALTKQFAKDLAAHCNKDKDDAGPENVSRNIFCEAIFAADFTGVMTCIQLKIPPVRF